MSRSGLIVVDKPAGVTSHDVVARIRRLARTRRVGHGGTLDPMATGVLVIGVERATRLLTYVIGSEKSYRATVRLGQSTVTDDAEGELTAKHPTGHLSDDEVRAALESFRGELHQVPSAVSAIKVNGVRSYARVRAGHEVELAPRLVTISDLTIHSLERIDEVIDVDIDVSCSSGTYIRAIARDAGKLLGVGGHLTALRRTAVGRFTLAEASTLDELAALEDPVTLPLTDAAQRCFARRDVDAELARVLGHGGPLPPVGLPGAYAVFGPDGEVIAVVAERDGKARAEVVLAPSGGEA